MTFQLHRVRGIGLPNVFVSDGVNLHGDGDERSVSYPKLEGLYDEVARAISLSRHQLAPAEFRFLRKRLGLSQSDLALAFGKSDQAVAKWEKGLARVPLAEGSLLKLLWLEQTGRTSVVSQVVADLRKGVTSAPEQYVFEFAAGRWRSLGTAADEVLSDAITTGISVVLEQMLSQAAVQSSEVICLETSSDSAQPPTWSAYPELIDRMYEGRPASTVVRIDLSEAAAMKSTSTSNPEPLRAVSVFTLGGELNSARQRRRFDA